MIYSRPGPGCNVHAWRVPQRDGSLLYFLRFGEALESRHPFGPHLSTDDLGIFADTMAALRRAGFLIPDEAFRRISDEISARDKALAEEKARQMDMFAGAG